VTGFDRTVKMALQVMMGSFKENETRKNRLPLETISAVGDR